MDTIIQIIDTLKQTLGIEFNSDLYELIIQLLILVVLVGTAIFISRQLRTQNNMLEVQLLKDRITMGWSTDEPMTKEDINNVKFLPDKFIPDKYKDIYVNMCTNKSNDKQEKSMVKIGKYLYLAKVYNYFLYVFASSSSMKMKDPLGTDWQDVWLNELVKDDVFKEIREFNRKSHRGFENFLKGKEESNNTSSTVKDNDSQEQNNANQV